MFQSCYAFTSINYSSEPLFSNSIFWFWAYFNKTFLMIYKYIVSFHKALVLGNKPRRKTFNNPHENMRYNKKAIFNILPSSRFQGPCTHLSQHIFKDSLKYHTSALSPKSNKTSTQDTIKVNLPSLHTKYKHGSNCDLM